MCVQSPLFRLSNVPCPGNPGMDAQFLCQPLEFLQVRRVACRAGKGDTHRLTCVCQGLEYQGLPLEWPQSARKEKVILGRGAVELFRVGGAGGRGGWSPGRSNA